MNKTSIEWTDYTWNPVTGCTKISQGCKNCYAETMTNRFAKAWGVESFRQVIMHTDRLNEPLKMKKKLKGKKVFVCDMSDLFHEAVSFEFIYAVFSRIGTCRETIFQILTKRIDRALEFYQWFVQKYNELGYSAELLSPEFPFPNVWIGTSVEDQKTANERIPVLLQIPAKLHFLSCEPLLGPIDLTMIDIPRDHPRVCFIDSLRGLGYGEAENTGNYIGWVIAGGESGHGARPMHSDWVRSLRDKCRNALIPFFFKQWGAWWPADQLSGKDWASIKENEPKKDWIVPGDSFAYKVGKKKSGNTIDGKQHLEFPKF